MAGAKPRRHERLAARALGLQKLFGIEKVETLGLFEEGSGLALIEYVTHELAHGFTMGFTQFPRRLSGAIAGTLNAYSAVTQDHLEIDTTYVTHGALLKLGLVSRADQSRFAEQCAESLVTDRYNGHEHLVMHELELRGSDTALHEHANRLVSLFRVPLPLVRTTYLLPDDGK